MIYTLVMEGRTSEERAEVDDLLAGRQQQTARAERIAKAREAEAMWRGAKQ